MVSRTANFTCEAFSYLLELKWSLSEYKHDIAVHTEYIHEADNSD